MKGLLFLARLALICNVFFLACLVFQRVPDPHLPQAVVGVMAILGIVLAFFINLAFIIAYLVNVLRKRQVPVAPWLVITNIVFFIAQVLIQIIFA